MEVVSSEGKVFESDQFAVGFGDFTVKVIPSQIQIFEFLKECDSGGEWKGEVVVVGVENF